MFFMCMPKVGSALSRETNRSPSHFLSPKFCIPRYCRPDWLRVNGQEMSIGSHPDGRWVNCWRWRPMRSQKVSDRNREKSKHGRTVLDFGCISRNCLAEMNGTIASTLLIRNRLGVKMWKKEEEGVSNFLEEFELWGIILVVVCLA